MKTLLVAIMLMFATPTLAAELLMIHSPTCIFCQAFMRDVEPGYSESEQAKEYPLWVVDISDPIDKDWINVQLFMENMRPIRGTPTFIIWNDDREVGRFVGYGGKEWFYRKLDILIKEKNDSPLVR